MKSLRILAVACATFLLANIAHAQIKAGASSLGVFGSIDKPSGGDASGNVFGSYNYFFTDTIALDLGGGLFFSKGSNGYLADANVSFYLSRDKVAPYVGFGAGYFKAGGGGGGDGVYRAYTGAEFFTSERTSFDTRLIYQKADRSRGGDGSWTARFGFKIYFN
jgi:hypothetical protein